MIKKITLSVSILSMTALMLQASVSVTIDRHRGGEISISTAQDIVFNNVTPGLENYGFVIINAAAGNIFGATSVHTGDMAWEPAGVDSDTGSISVANLGAVTEEDIGVFWGGAVVPTTTAVMTLSSGTRTSSNSMVFKHESGTDDYEIRMVDQNGVFVSDAGVASAGDAWLIQQHKVSASDGGHMDLFGYHSSISGDRVAVGSVQDDVSGIDSGSVYIYDFNGVSWQQTVKLTASDGAAEDSFGSVSLSGDRLAVGAREDDANDEDEEVATINDTGSVYIYDFDGTNWIETAKVTASDAGYRDTFGSTVVVSGDLMFAPSTASDDTASNAGAVYVFRYDGSNWVEEAKLLASDAAANDSFGADISFDGNNVLLVGAYLTDDNGANSGSAYVFRYDGSNWVEEAKLAASDAAAYDQFGLTVVVEGGVAVVGARLNDDAGSSSGSAYVFRYEGSNWVEEVKLTASDGAANDVFGGSVAISGDKIIVGAVGDESAAGSVYTYQYDGSNWIEQTKFNGDDLTANDEFSFNHISFSGNRMLIGARNDDDKATDCGAAYVFELVSSLSEYVSETVGFITVPGVSDQTPYTFTEVSDPDGMFEIVGNEVRIDPSANLDYDVKTTHQLLVGIDDGAGENYQKLFTFNVVDSDEIKAKEEHYFIDEDSVLNVAAASGVLANDVDCSKTGLTLSLVRAPGYGDFVFNADGSFVYTPKYEYSGSVTFSYTVTNGLGYTETVISKITVNDVNDAPSNIDLLVDHQLLASDGDIQDYFGGSVSVSGDIAAVGSYKDNNNGLTNTGSVYIYRYNGKEWIEEAKLIAGDAAKNDHFGNTVSLHDNVLVVSAYKDDHNGIYNSGSVYVFRYDGNSWVEEAKLAPSDAAESDFLGSSISLSTDVFVVGSTYDDDSGSESGSVYVFRYDGSNWSEEAKIIASDGAANDYYGGSTSISGNILVVGSLYDDDDVLGEQTGSAYVYRYDGSAWVEEVKLVADDAATYSYFGKSVSLSGDVIAISAYVDTAVDKNAGSVYVYRHDGSSWVKEAKIFAGSSSNNDSFGGSISLSGNTLAVGVDLDDDNGYNNGSVYIYRYDGSGWVADLKLIAGDSSAFYAHYGISVSLSGDRLAVGSNQDSTTAVYAGTAHVYDLAESISFAEDAEGGLVISDLFALDVDSNPYTFTVVSDPDNVFEIVDNQLRVISGAQIDFETKDSHQITVQIDDGDGGSYQKTFSINVTDVTGDNLPGYAAWKSTQLSGLANDPTDDPDGDGVPNYVEFAFSMNPSSGAGVARENMPKITGGSGAGSNLGMEYTRTTDIDESNLIYECSNDLQTWFEPVVGVDYVLSSVVDNSDGTETVSVELLNTSNQCFMRVKVIAE